MQTSAALSTDGLVSLSAIRDAAARIRGVARRTALVQASPSWEGSRLFLKCENQQPAGAFKIRGAYNMMIQLPADERRRGVITYSSGNHGQAVALSAKLLGVPAVIVMPTTAPRVKVDGAQALGADVIFEGTTTLERRARAEAEQMALGLTMIPPFDHEAIIAGQGTLGLEMMEQCPDATAIYVQVGGGGLASGVAAAVKRLNPQVRVIGVEPDGAPKMSRSLAAGHPVVIDRPSSIADGLLAVTPGALTFRHVQALVDEVVTVTDQQIADAVRWIFREGKVVAEPSGAVSVAALLAARAAGRVSRTTIAVLSGGNVAPDLFARLLTGESR